jgi:DNA-directed DNA polymerase III PolC
LLDGMTKIPDLMAHVKASGMDTVAQTDHGAMFGSVEFLTEARKAGVKPILGCEAYTTPNRRSDRPGHRDSHHLTLLAKTGRGVRNLMRLSSLAYLEGFYYVPRVDKELLEAHSEGVICLSGCIGSELSEHLLEGRADEAVRLAQWYTKVFGDDFYLEIQNNGIEKQRQHVALATTLANRVGVPLVGTSDAHYMHKSDAVAHDILLCVSTHSRFGDADRLRFETNEYHVRTPEEMYAAMPGHAEAVGRSAEIADSVEEFYPSLGLGARQFPSFACPDRAEPEAYLTGLCRGEFPGRYGDDPKGEAAARLRHELKIICDAGYATYFLTLWDIVRYAREHGIRVSARGSACGSVVSYLLGISSFCPLAHGLLFERFLDPSRGDPPDIDLDIDKLRRAEVLQYVRDKYGEDNVAQISTFGTMGARSVIKDVGRVLNVAYNDLNDATEMVPAKLGTTLRGTLEADPAFKAMFEPREMKRVLEYSLGLEGTVRSAGIHAAGVVITPKPLIECVPLRKDKDGVVATQWGMEDLEKAGFLKMDFLGLRTMTILDQVSRATGVEPASLPLGDPGVYALLRRGESKGVFQLDGDGMRDLLLKMKPDRFADIVALVALYRPGPIEGGMIKQYNYVKHGRREATYLHPVMEQVLAETYGVMVYQEQIMRILNLLAGMSLTRAYACIKAISKKKPKEVAAFREEFEKGAAGKVDAETAAKIFDLINVFSHYGFNKCVSGDTKILRPGANSHVGLAPYTVEEMYRIRNDIGYAKATNHRDLRGKWVFYGNYGMGLSLCDDGRIRQNAIVDIQPVGIRPVYEITLSNGATIKTTGNHKFPTRGGELTVEQMIRALEGHGVIEIPTVGGYEKTDSSRFNFSNMTREEALAANTGKSVNAAFGESNVMWTGGSYTNFAAFRSTEPNVCRDCGTNRGRIETHHVNGDRTNSSRENLVKLCASCHKKREYKVGRVRKGQKGYPSVWVRVESIQPAGETMTYDVTMAAPNHTFAVESGIVTCNSHATAYAMLAYQTAWFKVHHPLEFMRALLSSEMDGAEREKYLGDHVADCRRMGITVRPPDVNVAGVDFITQEEEGDLVFGLAAVKEMTREAAALIVAERGHGPFTGLQDFVERTGAQQALTERLVHTGAFDQFGPRGPMLAGLPALVKGTKKRNRVKARGQGFLFDGGEVKPLPAVAELSDQAKAAAEKKVLGFYLSTDPAAPYRQVLELAAKTKTIDISTSYGETSLGGVITSWKTFPIRTGNMIRFTISDNYGVADGIVWPDQEQFMEKIKVGEGWVGVLEGKVDRRNNRATFVAQCAIPVSQVQGRAAKAVKIRVDALTEGGLGRLLRVVRGSPGPADVLLEARGHLWKAGGQNAVKPDRELVGRLKAIAGDDAVTILT